MAAGSALRIALVHDWLNQVGGAENVLEELVNLFPGRSIYTSIYAADRMPDQYRQWPIQTSFMQHLPAIASRHQAYLPLYPLAFGRTNLEHYDLVLSNKSGFCHGVRTGDASRNGALHVCYCLTPTRFLWLYDQYREREQISRGVSAALQPMLAYLRRWDWAAAQRVDRFIAISTTVQDRIRDVYGKESAVIHPPVDISYFRPDSAVQVGDYYLIVSRLIPYKRIDLAVRAFRELPDERLLIVGTGRDLDALQSEAGPNVTFLGRQSRQRVRELLRGCKAFIFPGLEDFGIAPVEAMSTGRPVVAFAGGGAIDTVISGVSGALFAEQSVDSLLQTLRNFRADEYDPDRCRRQAERFGSDVFRDKLMTYLEEAMNRPIRTLSAPTG
jgi:glycosyltransferase involved in cell wall biosynthesis